MERAFGSVAPIAAAWAAATRCARRTGWPQASRRRTVPVGAPFSVAVSDR